MGIVFQEPLYESTQKMQSDIVSKKILQPKYQALEYVLIKQLTEP